MGGTEKLVLSRTINRWINENSRSTELISPDQLLSFTDTPRDTPVWEKHQLPSLLLLHDIPLPPMPKAT